MREELAALKKAHAERIESEQRASARAREEAEARQLLSEVKANSDSHPDPAIQMLSKVPGFNEQVFQAIMKYPQHDEAKIYATVANGFSQLIADLEAAGLVSRNGAGNTAKVPAQASAKPEARSAGKPDKPARRVATISTQSAEPATPEPWDPRKDAEAWERHKRKRYG
jgi:hypothetical protein